MPKYLRISTTDEFNIDKKIIHSIISFLVKELKLKFSELEINFVDNKTILELNIKYLKHNYETDVITLSYPDESLKLNGYVFISYEKAKENSKRYKQSFKNEILRLIIHGILHLVGYDDKTKKQKQFMSNEEDRILKKIRIYKNLLK
ncbi:MAG: rRNA maturation RNase YbeY [Ignavibacteriales bacterium]|nr:rRNA maturation RNase YbeY [Ignavibacteriales bacterium]